MSGPLSESAVRALLAKGSGRNFAASADASEDPRLVPLTVRASLTDMDSRIRASLGALPRWRLEAADGPVYWATRRTRLFRFTDDIYILVEPAERDSILRFWSGSRVGRGDLGQNRRNINELRTALLAAATSNR